MIIYLTCGLPGSGKSTWAKKFTGQHPNTIIVCKDNIRTMLHGEYKYNRSIEVVVKEICKQAIKIALRKGFDIIIDETNINRDKRHDWIEFIQSIETEATFTIVFFPEAKNNLENRMKDNRGYTAAEWEEVINSMKKDFESPNIIELPEGGKIETIEGIVR